MPPVSEQMALPGSVTNPTMFAARFLLKPGRKYEDAVKSFQLYNETKEVNEEARKPIAQLIKLALTATRGNLVRALIFINNRLGNAQYDRGCSGLGRLALKQRNVAAQAPGVYQLFSTA